MKPKAHETVVPFDPDRKPTHHSIPEDEHLSSEVITGEFGSPADESDPEAYAERREKIDKVVTKWAGDFTDVLRVHLSEVALGIHTEAQLVQWAEKNIRDFSKKLRGNSTTKKSL